MQQYIYTSEDIHKRKENDAYFRLNYLYQASLLFQNSNIHYSQFLKKEMNKVAEKVPIRMTPQLKATHCKKCHAPIATVDTKFIKSCNKLFIQKKCQICGKKRKFFIKKLKNINFIQQDN